MSWAAEEFATVELGDKRLVKLAQRLGAAPGASIPAACGDWGDTAGAYRLLDNECCDWREIIEAHGRRTLEHMTAHAVVLCQQDTTELDFNGQCAAGLGPLSYEAQRGMWARQPKDATGWRARAGRKARVVRQPTVRWRCSWWCRGASRG